MTKHVQTEPENVVALPRSSTTVDRILDAAESCFAQAGLKKTTMSDIIARSQLARTTVYRHFKTRDDIISQVVLRDIDYLIRQLEQLDGDEEDIETRLVEVLYLTISEIVQRPLLNALFSQDPILLNKLGLSNAAVLKYMQRAIRPMFNSIRAAGRLRQQVTLEDYAEWSGRMTMSFVLTPYRFQSDPVKMRNYIANFIVPSLLTARSEDPSMSSTVGSAQQGAG